MMLLRPLLELGGTLLPLLYGLPQPRLFIHPRLPFGPPSTLHAFPPVLPDRFLKGRRRGGGVSHFGDVRFQRTDFGFQGRDRRVGFGGLVLEGLAQHDRGIQLRGEGFQPRGKVGDRVFRLSPRSVLDLLVLLVRHVPRGLWRPGTIHVLLIRDLCRRIVIVLEISAHALILALDEEDLDFAFAFLHLLAYRGDLALEIGGVGGMRLFEGADGVEVLGEGGLGVGELGVDVGEVGLGGWRWRNVLLLSGEGADWGQDLRIWG